MTITDPLDELRDVDEDTLLRLRGTLADRAAAADLLDLAYRTVDSPARPAAAGRHRPRPDASGLRESGT